MKKIVAFIALALISSFAHAQTLQDTLAQIDKIFSTYQPQNPGCELAISRNGVIIYSKAWGMADLEHQVRLTTASVTEAGSVSKQFTAAAILLLAQQGKLSLQDDIRKYLPEIPDYGSVIRISNLLHHTSGLRDWGSVMDIAGWPRSTKTYSNDDVLYIVSHQKDLNNKPGDEFIYSNSNFNMQALIVKRITGMELAEFTRKYIFEPAGMTHTQWRDNFKHIVLNRAIAYDKLDTGYQTDMPNEYAYGNGGLLTTAEDLLKWNEYYWSGKLGSPSLLSQQIAVDHLNNGTENAYAMGLFIQKRRGWDYVNHDGATAGYRSFLLCYPQLKLSIAFLSNVSDVDFGMIHRVEDLFVPNKEVHTAQATPPAYPMSVDQLKAFTGWYRNQKTGNGLQLMIKNDTLRTARFKLRPVGRNSFTANGEQVIFNDKGLIHISKTKDTTVYAAVKVADNGEDYLKAYTGVYYSSETESKYIVILKNGKLTLHIDPVNDEPINPTYYDGFKGYDGDDVYFTRDAGNKITGFKISVSRARNVTFVKMQQ
ncbi:CubicO group peptidase (beta-lactamase class C family) [Mucilaginibacter lappiensis]|uniref:CubicO group peptidase (Beta-lactamase class C family) n=1 Tax=Mucilaginibacter lappiensis TaxID=354630 RepID=A0ABR6PMR7_9SPHI|nr:serine hydrolase domain-containing protein [Mucilaginibacter lappiensis]MBB6111071.1 CubicO group peptidase (beta-lactamase class C family) [Mucilaginibacter lappiensis]